MAAKKPLAVTGTPATSSTAATTAAATPSAGSAQEAAATTRRATAKRATAKQATAKQATAKQATAKSDAPAPAKRATATKSTATKSTRKRSAATPQSGATSPAEAASAAADTETHNVHILAPRLRVKPQESPWTVAELTAVRAEVESDIDRLLAEIVVAEEELAGLMRDGGDSAGDDQADVGTRTFERLQEMSLADNSRVMLEQSRHALDRMVDGSYGICEVCGEPIGKLRLQAFPRATLCMTCKQKQERH